MQKATLGKTGEDTIRRLLVEDGYRVICSNYRGIGFEVDHIAAKENILYVIEVKARKTFAGRAWEVEALGITQKRKIMARGARHFLSSGLFKSRCSEVRFMLYIINQRGQIWQ
jgi:Holliday junction resolvase-like predicted endonuclease